MVEIVDSAAKVRAFLPLLDAMIGKGLVTATQTEVLVYRRDVE